MNKAEGAVIAGSVVAMAQIIGTRSGPTPSHPRTAAWYAALRKPSFTPPAPVFGVAWTALDALLVFAGYRLLISKQSPRRSIALGTWSLNLLGIAGFSWVLFGRKKLDEALGVTVGMVATSAATAATAAQVDRKAAYASVPLLTWVLFASFLQEEVWRRNS
jgi:benzodiazapine receptor